MKKKFIAFLWYILTQESSLIEATVNGDTLSIYHYLKSLDGSTRHVVLVRMNEKANAEDSKTEDVEAAQAGGCAGGAPSTSPTPYGSWECQFGNWVWVPELGNNN